jgi:hypothetical protein
MSAPVSIKMKALGLLHPDCLHRPLKKLSSLESSSLFQRVFNFIYNKILSDFDCKGRGMLGCCAVPYSLATRPCHVHLFVLLYSKSVTTVSSFQNY